MHASIPTSVKSSVNWVLQAATPSVKLAAILAVALVATGCAAPTGTAFTKAEAAPEGQAHVYVYRKDVFYAHRQNASVKFNNQEMGKLFNGSWMRLTLAPGEHVLGVMSSPISETRETKLQLVDRQTQYFEYSISAPRFVYIPGFPSISTLINASPIWDVAPRTPEQGVADMQGLKGVK